MGLDALRGAAALVVLSLHIEQHILWHRSFFSHGALGVDLFFMLSGFVIGLVYEERLSTGNISLREYAEIRIVRLYPMILVGVTLGMIAALADIRPDHIGIRFIFQLLVLPTLFSPGILFILNAAHWSLFFELIANAVHAVAVPLLTTRALSIMTASFAILYLAGAYYFNRFGLGLQRDDFIGGFLHVAFGFCAGLLIYRLWKSGRIQQPRRFGWLSLPLFAAAIVWAGMGKSDDILRDGLVIFVILPVVVWLALGINASGITRGIFRWAGLLSYPLYATQEPLIDQMSRLIDTLHLPGALLRIAWASAGLSFILAAYLFERFYDAPVRGRLRAWLQLRRTKHRVVTAP